RFADRCAAFGLPAVTALMVIENGCVVRSTEDGRLPEKDLFVKLLRGTGGRGAPRWEDQGDDQYSDHTRAAPTRGGLIEQLEALPLRSGPGCVVLPRLVNHPDMLEISNGALATVRAVTCRTERDEYEVTNASLRMAQGGASIVDNFHAGGIVAKVD